MAAIKERNETIQPRMGDQSVRQLERGTCSRCRQEWWLYAYVGDDGAAYCGPCVAQMCRPRRWERDEDDDGVAFDDEVTP